MNRTDILPRVGERSEFLKFLIKEKASCPTLPSDFLKILEYRTFSINEFYLDLQGVIWTDRGNEQQITV